MTPNELLAHHDAGTRWPIAVSDAPNVDFAAALALAGAVTALRIARGERPRGHKIGFTNRSIWPRYGVDTPIWGTVWDTTLSFADASGTGALSLARTAEPRIEPEAVFGLASDVPPEADIDTLFRAVDWIAPGFEIVQSHRAGWKFRAADAIADGGLHARLLVGPRVGVARVASDARELDAVLGRCAVSLEHEGRCVESGRGDAVLGGPLSALHDFLRARGAALEGRPGLAAGDIVTTGTWTDAWPVAPGETWTARFDAPLGTIGVRFD